MRGKDVYILFSCSKDFNNDIMVQWKPISLFNWGSPQINCAFVRRSPWGGGGGLHQDFLEIDFLVVSDRGEW